MRTAGDHGETGFHGGPFIFGIDFEVAEEFFGDDFFSLAIKRLQVGARAQANLGDFAGEFRGVTFAAGHGAGYGIDDDVFGCGIVLGGVGVFNAEDVAGELDEGVLKASAGAEIRPVAAAGELDAFEHAVETLVGTARRGPEAVEAFEKFFRAGVG